MNETEADDGRADTSLWDSRFFAIIGTTGIGALAATVFATSHLSDDYLSPQQFAGCYVAAGIDPLELTPSGKLRSARTDVGRFRVVAPVGGKHGTLIEATDVNVMERNGRAFFLKGSGGFLWPITANALSITYAPDGQIQLTRHPVAACR